MRQLLASSDVTGTQDMRYIGAQIIVGFNSAFDDETNFLKTEAGNARLAADRNNDVVIVQRLLTGWPRNNQLFATRKVQSLVTGQYCNTVGQKALCYQCGRIRIFLQQQSICHFDYRNLTSQPLERLCQLAADRPAAQYDQPFRHRFAVCHRIPQCLTGQIAAILDARQRRDQRCGTRCDDERLGRQPLFATIGCCNLDRPRIDKACVAVHAIDAEAGKAFDAVMWFDCCNDVTHAAHYRRKIDSCRWRVDAKSCRIVDGMGNPRALDKCF